MRVCVLGPLHVEDGTTTRPVGGVLVRRILARLALAPGRPVSFDDLEEAAWGDDPPAAARHTVATHVFRLRRSGIAIATRGDGYVLELPTDVEELERLTADGRAARDAEDPEAAATCLRAALVLARGRPFADLEDLPAATAAATRIEELLDGVREDLLALDLDRDASTQVIARARELTEEQPFRERRWELLMLALYRAGRQAEALDAYAACRRRLLDDLGLDPGAGLRRMQQAVLAQDPALDPPVRPRDGDTGGGSAPDGPAQPRQRSGNGVPGTSTRLIGRDEELRDLAEAWGRARLVSIIGPPGAGKTRLALESAREAPEPVWFVALEQLPPAQSVASAILEVVQPASRASDASDGVARAIGPAAGLLVLDGVEARQAEVATEAARLLASCPALRILVTTRERLGLLDEARLPVGPLPAEDAIALLVDRARLVDPRFRLADDDAGAATRLCALVDGLPLGIELVARHLQRLRVEEVAQRVEADLGRWAGGPAGGRAGLWAALDASVERLAPAERQALAALALMVADADLELIEEVAGFENGDGTVEGFDVVGRLVDASLAQVRSAGGPTRYELFRTVAAHALATTSDAVLAPARARYRAAVLDRATRLAAQLATPVRSAALGRLDREMPHVRAILGLAADRTADGVAADGAAAGQDATTRCLELAVALTDYWLGRHPAEGLDWLGRLIAASRPELPLRASALLASAHLAYWVTDFPAGAALAEEARSLFAELGDALGEGRALRRQGAIAAATDDITAARAFLEASLDRFDAAGAEREVGTTLLHLGSLLADEGLVDLARPPLERARAIAIATGDPLAHGHALAALNLASWKGGDLEGALQSGNQALLIFRELGHRPTEGTVAYRLSAVARGLGRPRAARRYATVALDAGRQSDTRTTVALAQLNLARLDLDAGAIAAAAVLLLEALERTDPEADRWVLADVLEASARLLVEASPADRLEPLTVTSAETLLATAAAIRVAIRQPIAPTESADLEATVERIAERRSAMPVPGDSVPVVAPAEALELGATAIRAVARTARPESGPGPTVLDQAGPTFTTGGA